MIADTLFQLNNDCQSTFQVEINIVVAGSSVKSAEIRQWSQAQQNDPMLQDIFQRIQDGKEHKYQIL